MKPLIDKYIKRIKIDYPEDDKLYMDLEAFANDIKQQLPIHSVVKSLPTKEDMIKIISKRCEKAPYVDVADAVDDILNYD